MTAENEEARSLIYANSLARLIQKETVSKEKETDISRFLDFHQVLAEEFPHIFAVCERETFDGSLLLRWPGEKNAEPVMFMNHHDTVEATGSWKYPPFSGQLAEGKVWGRGTLDTKGGLWSMLQAADELASEGFRPQRDIYFESACNEETTGQGAQAIARILAERGVHFSCVFDEGGMIVEEPIGGAHGLFAMVGLGEKGWANLRFVAHSSGGHASAPGPDTPLVRLGRFMAEMDDKDPFTGDMSPVVIEMLRRLAPYMGRQGWFMAHAGTFKKLLCKVMAGMSPTAKAIVKSTLAFTMAGGSDGFNVLPQEAWIGGNLRFTHHQDLEASLAVIRPIADKHGVEVIVEDGGLKSGLSDFKARGFRLMEEAVSRVFPQVKCVVPYIMTGGSDSRYFDKLSDNCYRFVPFVIDQEQMNSIHGLNECVDIATLAPSVAYNKFLMKEL